MSQVTTSIIIPVYNQWQFTKNCLEALSKTLSEESYEILIIDNGSSDETKNACETFGKKLFESRFCYQRLEKNINFGPASNFGAKKARGEFLLFLNNDTIPQTGWLRPLLNDFTDIPRLGASGPLLLYPESEPFGNTVQHLGVTVTPYNLVSHLYEGIPSTCSLAKKRRFFQIITAACMLIPKKYFMNAGMFDEHYINGIEDVDLCAQLFADNLRMTVNTASSVIHYTSQTPGRSQHESENFNYFQEHSQILLSSDMAFQVEQDNLELRLSPWLVFYPHCKKDVQQRLDILATKLPEEKIVDLLLYDPLWLNGWEKLSKTSAMLLEKAKLFPSPENFFELFQDARRNNDRRLAQFALNWTVSFYKPWHTYIDTAQKKRDYFSSYDNLLLRKLFDEWLANSDKYKNMYYNPFIKKLDSVLHINLLNV